MRRQTLCKRASLRSPFLKKEKVKKKKTPSIGPGENKQRLCCTALTWQQSCRRLLLALLITAASVGGTRRQTRFPRKASFNTPTRRFLNKQIKNSQSANTISRVPPPRGLNNKLSEKGDFISTTSNGGGGGGVFLRGHYPGQGGQGGLGVVDQIAGAPYVTGETLCTQRAGRGGSGSLDQSSDMFTLQLRIFLRARPSCRSSQAPEC